MADDQVALLRGTLDMLVLRTLEDGALHGYGIARAIEESTDDALKVEEGSLYPALYRMDKKGWIRSEWGKTDNNRRARFYALTRDGRRHLEQEHAGWKRFIEAVRKVMEPA